MTAAHAALARRHRVAVLGATGAVGQAFIRMLANHPWFELTEVAASERSAGKTYREAAHWIGVGRDAGERRGYDGAPVRSGQRSRPTSCSRRSTRPLRPTPSRRSPRAGKMVLTNAKNYRMEPDVPLVIAEVNPIAPSASSTHSGAIAGGRGAIVANGNCASIVAALPLAPIHERFGIAKSS